MNKKGQMELGVIIMIFITIIIGTIFLTVIAQSVGESVNTVVLVNQTETLAANGASIFITEWRAIDSIVILNASNNITILAANYTVTNDVVDPTTGGLSIQITTDDTQFASTAVKISGTVQPTTYIADGGARAMANLIIIMFALAVLVVIIGPSVSREFLASLSK